MSLTSVEWENVGDGRICYRNSDVDVRLEVMIRPAQVGERIVIGELILTSAEGVRTGLVNALRLESIEASLNHKVREMAEAAMAGEPSPKLIRQRLMPMPTAAHLTVPDKSPSGYGDRFYKQVADIYVAAVERGEAPAPVLVKASNKPLATVRRWIVECRRRGFLAEGSKGRAG
jgi:hypothetical protein